MENLSFRQFWARCFKDAFSRGWATGGLVNAILSLIVPFAPLLDVHSGQHLAQWTWIGTYSVALATLGAIWMVVAGRLLIYAPYKVYLQDQSKHSLAAQDLQKQIGDKDVRLLEFDLVRQKELAVHAFGESFHELYKEGKQLEREYNDSHPVIVPTLEKVSEWQGRVAARLSAEIRKNLSMQYGEISPAGAWPRDAHEGVRREASKLFQQVAFLRRIIDDPSVFALPK